MFFIYNSGFSCGFCFFFKLFNFEIYSGIICLIASSNPLKRKHSSSTISPLTSPGKRDSRQASSVVESRNSPTMSHNSNESHSGQ